MLTFQALLGHQVSSSALPGCQATDSSTSIALKPSAAPACHVCALLIPVDQLSRCTLTFQTLLTRLSQLWTHLQTQTSWPQTEARGVPESDGPSEVWNPACLQAA